jgi:hypothetical protein
MGMMLHQDGSRHVWIEGRTYRSFGFEKPV